jgi:nitroreductase
MELVDGIRHRRSALTLTEPAPSDEDLLDLLADAVTGPDHGRMRPWRLIAVRGQARRTLGTAFAVGLTTEEEGRAAAKPMRAPLLLSIVFAPKPNPKVPDWEQLAATTCVVYNLGLLLDAHGWGTMWRTGPPSRSPEVREILGLAADERLLGWLYVGTPGPGTAPPRPALDARAKLFSMAPDGHVTQLLPTVDEGVR